MEVRAPLISHGMSSGLLRVIASLEAWGMPRPSSTTGADRIRRRRS